MFLYILQGKRTGRYYIGITNDISRRIIEHNTTSKHYTGKQSETWSIMYMQTYKIELEARKEEIRLKKAKNRKYLQWYIKNKNQEFGK